MALSRSPRIVREWFANAFEAPTPAQEQAWPAIASGEHVLISAPTGSGKTLAAFLWALDGFVARPAERGTIRLVYISPLKALSYDVERNLRAPLRGLGLDVRVGIRTGDTSPRERAAMLRSAPDILITTPESLYLMLTSRARDLLGTVEAVIVDEIHAVAATKRGAHFGAHARAPRGPARWAPAPANRPVGYATPARGDRALHGRAAAHRDDRRREWPARARPPDPRAGGVDGRARARDRRRPVAATGWRRGDAAFDLAGDLPAAARARTGAPLDDPVRQQQARGRAPRAAPERARRRGRRAGGDRAGPPRLARARGANDD